MGVETLDKGGQQSPTWTLPEETEVTRSARVTNETIGFLQVEIRLPHLDPLSVPDLIVNKDIDVGSDHLLLTHISSSNVLSSSFQGC